MAYRPAPALPVREHVVLVVEDDHQVRRTLVRALSGAGYHPVQAPDALLALEVLRGEAVRLVITDLNLPGADGSALGWAVRRHHSDIPILVISGGAPPEVLPPNTTFLGKPFGMAALLRVVCRLSPIPQCDPDAAIASAETAA